MRFGQGSSQAAARFSSRAGTVLVEVVLALLLFVGAAAVISGALSASIDALDRLRLNMHATDLGVTLVSELQLGLKPLETGGPEPFDPPFDLWTWELEVSPKSLEPDDPYPLRTVEVIIRHEEENVVYRLTQVLPEVPLITLEEQPEEEPEESPADSDLDAAFDLFNEEF